MFKPTSMTPEMEALEFSARGSREPPSVVLIGICSNDVEFLVFWVNSEEEEEEVGIYSPLHIVLKVYVYNDRTPLSDCDGFLYLP